jgi:2,5-furandicarboxylate decarboxylase 1
MPFEDLRSWLEQLKRDGELIHWNEPADLRYDIPRILEEYDGRSAVLFEKPAFSPTLSNVVVGNTLGSRAQAARALGVNKDEVLKTYLRALEKPVPPREVRDSAAPVLEVEESQVRVDLLPAPWHHEKDSGRYLTAPVVVARSLSDSACNWSIHRFQLNDAEHLGIFMLPRHLWQMFAQAEGVGKDLPIALVIGLPPVYTLASQAITPYGIDEAYVAGALLGHPAPLVKSPRYGLLVPATAEFLIEGRILANVRQPEGRFGEFPRTYGPRSDKPVMRVDAIYHRRDPYFQTIMPAGREHMLLGAIPRESTLYKTAQQVSLNVKDVVLTFASGCRYHAVVSMRPKLVGEAKNVILATFAGANEVKRVVVVDEDIDIHSAEDVEWAIATRFQPSRDLVVITDALGSPLDPSAYENGRTDKWGLDATIPVGADLSRYERVKTPRRESKN